MSTFIRVSNVLGPWMPISPAVRSGCTSFFLFGDTLEKTKSNNILGSASSGDLTQIGTVSVNSNYVTCTPNTNFLQTNIADSTTHTFITVAKANGTFSAAVPVVGIVSASSLNNYGTGYSMSSSTTYTLRRERNNSGFTTNDRAVSVPSVTSWLLMVATIDTTSESNYLATGTPLDATLALTGTASLATQFYRIGSFYSTAATGVLDIAGLVHFNRALSSTERTAMVNQVRQIMSSRGITV